MSTQINQINTIVPIPPRPIKSNKQSLSLRLTDPNGLTRKHNLFINAYRAAGPGGSNAYRAALSAGYSESTARVASSVILKHPAVAKEIKRLDDLELEHLGEDENSVLRRMKIRARANMLDYLDIDENGKVEVNLKTINRDMGSCITEFSYDLQGRPRIRITDPQRADEFIAKATGVGKLSGRDSEEDRNTPEYLDSLIQKVIITQQINIVNNNNAR